MCFDLVQEILVAELKILGEKIGLIKKGEDDELDKNEENYD
jgi:hypothetical protein